MNHSPYGYSAVSTFEQCPFRYKCQYVDGLRTIPSDDPANALIIGTALHRGIETDVDTAIWEYFNTFPVISDQHIDEEIKLRYLIPKVKEVIPEGIHEVQVVDTNFIGTLDLLVPMGSDEFDLYDFKYINPKNQDRYMESRQLHLYKYYWEKTNPGKQIRNMYFVFVPKVQIRQKRTETLFQFRQRLCDTLECVQPFVQQIKYNPDKVIAHLELTQDIMTRKDYPKNPTRLCDWCEYKNYCKGDLIDMLPTTNDVPITIGDHKKIWVYGEPFSGKTHLAAEAPKPILELNTDNNLKLYTMPRLQIMDTKDGRQTIPAWKVFKDAVDELEAGSEFKTIVLDLTEDIFDYARKYVCDERHWEHESDDSFKAYEITRSEFLRVIRKLVNLPYNIILISHQDISKDITKRSGDKVTKIKPNIADKVANKLAGLVDIVVRTIKVDDEYTISTKTSDVIFGGGRLTGIRAVEVPSTWESIEEMYAQCIDNVVSDDARTEPQIDEPKPDTNPVESNTGEDTPPADERPKRRTRRNRQ